MNGSVAYRYRGVATAIVVVTLAALAALTCTGCGGDSPGDSCGKVQPCGGKVEGKWDVVGQCVDAKVLNQVVVDPLLKSFCPSASYGPVTVASSGTVAFEADLTFSTVLNSTIDFTLNLPSTCLLGVSCPVLGDTIRAEMALDPSGSQGTAFDGCTGTSTCACRFRTVASESESGRYTTSGTVLATLATGGQRNQQVYCVQGETLHLIGLTTTMNGGPMGMATIASDIVFQRR